MKKILFISSVCGVGKSSTLEYIKKQNLLDNYDIYDIDDLINVHDYEGKSSVEIYGGAIEKALLISKKNNIIIGSCANPVEIKKVNNIDKIDFLDMILIYCSNEELIRRLKARDESRNCGSDEFITDQIEYQNYMINHSDMFGLLIDNTNIEISEVSNNIVNYIRDKDKTL